MDLSAWAADKMHPNWLKVLDWLSLVSGIALSAGVRPVNNLAYRDAYNEVADRHGVRRPMLSPVKGQNDYLYLSKKPEFCVAGYIARSKGREIGSYAAMWYAPGEHLFKALKQDRANIEAEFGGALEWTQTAPTTFWVLSKMKANPDDPKDWPRQHEWMAKNIAALKSIMEPRLPAIIASLPQDALQG